MVRTWVVAVVLLLVNHEVISQRCGTIHLNVNATSGVNSVNLTWNNLSPVSYDVSWVNGNSFSQNLSGNTTSFLVTGLTSGQTYDFTVNTNGLSCFDPRFGDISNDVSTTQSAQVLSDPPSSLNTSSPTASSFVISWSPSFGATGYLLDVSTDAGFGSLVAGFNSLAVSGVSRQIAGLSAGTQYYWRVRAVNFGGTSANSIANSQTTLPAAPVVNNVSGVTNNSFVATWAAVQSATSYQVDLASDAGFASVLHTHTTTSTSQLVDLLNAGTTYYYRVRAVNATGPSGYSAGVAVQTIPANPSGLTTGSVSASSFVITWPPVAGASQYQLDVATTSAFGVNDFVAGFNKLAVGGTSQMVAGLAPGTNYYIRLRAINGSGTSGNSPTGSQITVPAAPIAVAASGITSTSFTTNWSTTQGASTYTIDIASDNGFNPIINSIANITGLSQPVTGLAPGTNYSYRVRAANPGGTSVNSSPIVVLTAPDIPTSFGASVTSGGTVLNVHWLSVATATDYELLVATDQNFSRLLSGYDPNVISGNASNTVSVTGVAPSTNYYLKLRAKNTSASSAYTNVAIVFTDPSGISNTFSVGPGSANPRKHVIGAADQLSFNYSGSRGSVVAAFFHRKNSETSFIAENLQGSNGVISVSLPDAWFDDLGLQYYISVSDDSGLPQMVGSPASPINVITAVSQFAIPVTSFGKEIRNYQVISFPYSGFDNSAETTLAQIFEPIMGAYDKKKWRLLQLSNGKNQDYLDGLSVSKPEQGKSYWFISKNPVELSFKTVGSYGNSVSQPFALSLRKGWNQIGNPFPHSLSWQEILTANGNPPGVGKLLVFDQSSASFIESDELTRFGGGFVFADQDATLLFRTTLSNKGGRAIGTIFEAGQQEWQLPIYVEMDGVAAAQSGVGMHHLAMTEKDALDGVTPPRFFNYIEFDSSVPGLEYKLSRNVVPIQDHYRWDFQLTSDVEGVARLSWSSMEAEKLGGQLILYDPGARILVDMSLVDKYQTSSSSALRIYFNVDRKAIGKQLNLGATFPNPFINEVKIPVDFKDGAGNAVHASAAIFDAAGNVVAQVTKVFDDGDMRYLLWDGKTSDGLELSCGLYIYQLRLQTSAGKHMVYTGKIIKQ